jgi:hypothetical protein
MPASAPVRASLHSCTAYVANKRNQPKYRTFCSFCPDNCLDQQTHGTVMTEITMCTKLAGEVADKRSAGSK